MFRERARYAADSPAALAISCLRAGIEAADPRRAVERQCRLVGDVLHVAGETYDLSTVEDVVILGAGKAADELAAGLEAVLGDRVTDGLVVTDDATANPTVTRVAIGDHPTPGEASVAATDAVVSLAESADEDTLVLAPVTGGGSALLCAPPDALPLAAIRTATRGLLDSGAPIEEVNAVRRACSTVKGGGLAAAAAPARVVTLLVSDVVGDDAAVVASGPTVPGPSDPTLARNVLQRRGVTAPDLDRWLDAADSDPAPDVPVALHVLVSVREAVDAACDLATDRGYATRVLSTTVTGEAREAGRFHAAVAREARASGEPVEPPAVVVSGGETTVTVTGHGDGGPNMEFAVAAAAELPPDAVVAAVDTDGRDGGTDAAGALVEAGTARAATEAALAENDTYRYLEDRDALLHTGPTGTNVNDLRVMVVR